MNGPVRNYWRGSAVRTYFAFLLAAVSATGAFAQSGPAYSLYGMPGMVDMPSAETIPDARISTMGVVRDDFYRVSLSFQAAPRLTASFRYSALDMQASGSGTNYDRSLGFAFRFIDEGEVRPAFTIGINDLLGTGQYAGEYVVASKTFEDRLTLSAGIGWGRLGSYGSFQNPLSIFGSSFDTRPGFQEGDLGGRPTSSDWFRGPAALFGGARWTINDQWALVGEYSSDAYENEVARAGFDRRSPFNFGLLYRPTPGIDLGLYSLYGSKVALSASFATDPRNPPRPGGRDPSPPPIMARADVPEGPWSDARQDRLADAFERSGLTLQRITIEGRHARVLFENRRYDAEPQAIGRAARLLSRSLPPQVDRFELVPVSLGMPLVAVTVERSDLETLAFEPDRAWQSYVRAGVADGADVPSFGFAPSIAGPQQSFRITPYISAALFDPDAPLRADAGLDFDVAFAPVPQFILSGKYRQKLVGNRDESTRELDTVLPPVRSNVAEYDRQGSSYLSHLTGELFQRPGRDLFGRVTVGYLERMFAGVSGELLWRPVQGPFAYGVEVNYVRQRDFDGGFGLQDYGVWTGHASGYFDMGGGYEMQLDLGRYLAGDWGGTLSVSRRFTSGWRVGAFATLTDVPFDDFGEGSFDKGIFIEAPFSRLSGEPSRDTFAALIRPVSRDGGARLRVRNRLNDVVQGYREPDLRNSWPRYWR
ncbi:YjbH domain-containing protein [Oceanomicrobium pacificus]|uniref:YjbH domain-containing protein n=1 Tax=Oceanomicrobium pacificus TaxID=2692916 RepID=A0A6B0TV31_9RHOB|nr:YjbH domain-containing protein [Oceanomicrobium pacificus]MXU65062.1 YjbH domain-containing protein [Oceanomicrobium pacificus]